MAKTKKKVDPIKQREKRAKIAAGVGGLIFLLVCAVEVPSLMKMLNQKPPQAASSTTATTPAASTPTGATSQLADVSAPSAPASSGSGSGLVDTDVPPPPSNDQQLVSFSLFQTKNPFVPQVPTSTTSTSTSTSTSPTTTTTTPTTTTPTQTNATQTTPTQTTPAPTSTVSVVPPAPSSTTTTQAPQPTAAISVNGVVSHVGSDGTFPSGSPVFRLVSWTKSSAQIAIVGGTYATGDPTLTIQVGVPVTLENQTDGKRYKLLLLSTP